MQNAITTLRIRNFKSIKDVAITPRRVNLIIGEPNVGKSNVLEAMSLLGGMTFEQKELFMQSFIRYERPDQIFYDTNLQNIIGVETNHQRCYTGYDPKQQRFKAIYISDSGWIRLLEARSRYPNYGGPENLFLHFSENDQQEFELHSDYYGVAKFDLNGKRVGGTGFGFTMSTNDVSSRVTIRPYVFAKGVEVGRTYATRFLVPPSGENLKQIIQTHSHLRKEIAQLFAYYGQKLMLRMASNELEVTKEVDELIYSVPYSSTADTLQRLIFYLAAIESNDDAVILFEEPEAHSYPVYVSQLGRRIAESRNNQFFVATHSPYLITEILETMLPDDEQAKELAIFVAYYEDYQTKLRQLTDAEVRGIRADGLDVFYNMDRLVHPDA